MALRQMQTCGTMLSEMSAEGVAKYLADARAPLWLDVTGVSDDDLAWLGQVFSFHPMALDDCRHVDQHSKVDEYDGYLFVAIAIPHRSAGGDEIIVDELQAFLGKDYLVTVHTSPLAPLAAVPAQFEREPVPNRRGASMRHQADFLLYLCADAMVDSYFPLLDAIDEEMDELEDRILQNPTQATLHRIFTLKQHLVRLRKLAGPLRETMNLLSDRPYPVVKRSTALYFRNVYDHLVRIYEIIEASRDLLGNSLDAYLSTVSNRLNEVMKRLTLITTVFMPISFLVGFGGMNFVQIPFDQTWAFAAILLLLAMTPVLMTAWFLSRRWV